LNVNFPNQDMLNMTLLHTWYPTHRRSQGSPGSHCPPKNFRISSHFVLWEVVSHTNYCC